MTGSTATDPDAQRASVVAEVARLVRDEPLGPWDHALLQVRCLTVAAEDTLLLTHDGVQREAEAPVEATALLMDLRPVMHVPGLGTWLTAEVALTADGSVSARFDADTEPAWSWAPDDAAYVEELAMHPRAPEHRPAWLRERLARAQAAGPLGGTWHGVRFSASFTAGAVLVADVDTAADPRAPGWAREVVARLAAQGLAARAGEGVDDETGTRHPTVQVDLGTGGYSGLAFWGREVSWHVDATASQVDVAGARRVLPAVRAAVEAVTGWRFVDARVTTEAERALLGLPAWTGADGRRGPDGQGRR